LLITVALRALTPRMGTTIPSGMCGLTRQTVTRGLHMVGTAHQDCTWLAPHIKIASCLEGESTRILKAECAQQLLCLADLFQPQHGAAPVINTCTSPTGPLGLALARLAMSGSSTSYLVCHRYATLAVAAGADPTDHVPGLPDVDGMDQWSMLINASSPSLRNEVRVCTMLFCFAP
jgi:hypothetical protein